MRKRLVFCLPILVLVGALIAPTAFAAEKYDVAASETFDPLGLFGPPVGYFLSPPMVKCPGHEPTGDELQPCPVGSRTHVRNIVLVSRVDSTDARVAGWMTVELNGNLDADFEGPVWGTFSIAVDSGGTWEGTWQGLRVAEGIDYWTATLHVMGKGFGGMVDGMKMMSEDQIATFTPLPIAYFGSIQGRLIDPN